ncbi:MAG TPA: IS110 family transposase [Terrimicrobium sp.]
MGHHHTTTKENTPKLIAIDIAKDSLQVRSARRSVRLENSPRGFKALLKEFPDKANILVVFEATGGYERSLAEFLHARKIAYSIVNPRLLRAFAKSEGIKAKSDPIDAEMIYRFASQKNLRPTPPPSVQQRKLADLLDRRTQLGEFLAREKNRLQKVPNKEVAASLRRCTKALEKEIALIEKELRTLIEDNPELKTPCQTITSVKGVGEITAWTILAQLREISQLSRNQLVALAGLAPFNDDSGKHSGKRFIHGGRAKVRRVLFMAARTAAQFNPVIRPYVQGLIARGKPYKCALTAAMRKILIHIQSLLKKSRLSPC